MCHSTRSRRRRRAATPATTPTRPTWMWRGRRRTTTPSRPTRMRWIRMRPSSRRGPPPPQSLDVSLVPWYATPFRLNIPLLLDWLLLFLGPGGEPGSFNIFFCAGPLSTYILQVWTLMILALPNFIFSFLIGNCFSCAELDWPGHLGGRAWAEWAAGWRRQASGSAPRSDPGTGYQHGQPVLHCRPERTPSREGKFMEFFCNSMGVIRLSSKGHYSKLPPVL